MAILPYSIEIAAPRERVWACFTDPGLYNQWANAFSSESQFVGSWEPGSTMLFWDPNMGGTKAVLDVVDAPSKIVARHIGLVDKEQNDDPDNEMADKWVGSVETYDFEVTDKGTLFTVTTETDAFFKAMFDDMWTRGLESLKTLAESEDA